MTGPGETYDFMDVPRARAGSLAMFFFVGLLVIGLIWGGMQVVEAAQGHDCQPVRDELAISQPMGRPDPSDAGKPVARIALPQLIAARQVDALGVQLVAAFVKFPGKDELGPTLWELRDLQKRPSHRESVEVIARNPLAHKLAPSVVYRPARQPRDPALDRAWQCALDAHRGR